MQIFLNVDAPERPLWFIVDTSLNDKGHITITNAGFGRFSTPRELNSFLNDTLGQVFSFLDKQVTASSTVAAINEVVNPSKLDSHLILQRVEFQEGSIVLYYQNNTPNQNGSSLQY